MNVHLEPPPGGDHNKGPAFLAVSLTTTIVALTFVGLRIYVRTRIVRALGWDDWTIVLAMILATVDTAINIPEVLRGEGRHEYYLTPDARIETLKLNDLTIPFVVMSPCFSKISICLFLLRIIGDANARKKRRFLQSMIIILFFINTLDIITVLVQCRPLGKLWDPQIPGACWNPKVQAGFAYMQGAFAALSDFLLAGFPIFIIKNLNMDRRTKYALSFVMGLGVFAAICTIVRTCLSGALDNLSDYTYTSVTLVIFASLEQNVCIVAACIPAIRPLFRSFSTGESGGKSRFPNRQGYTLHNSPGHTLNTFSARSTNQKGSESNDSMNNRVLVHSDVNVDEDPESKRDALASSSGSGIRKTTEVELRVDPRYIV